MIPLFSATTGLPWVKPVLLAIGLCVVFLGGWSTRGVVADRNEARMQAAWQTERIDAQASALRAQVAARAEEARRTQAAQEVAREAESRAVAARRDAAAAADVSRQLRERVAALVAARSRPPGDPATAAAGPPAGDPAVVLADVLGRIDARAGDLAALADARGIAGDACVSAYDSLRSPPTPAGSAGTSTGASP